MTKKLEILILKVPLDAQLLISGLEWSNSTSKLVNLRSKTKRITLQWLSKLPFMQPTDKRNLKAKQMTKKIRKLIKKKSHNLRCKIKMKKVVINKKLRLSMTEVKKFMMMLQSLIEAKKMSIMLIAYTILMRSWLWILIQRVKQDVFKNLFLRKKI